MQRLEVSGAVRQLQGSLGIKGVILWHIYEKPRFKSDGQEDVTNNQLETLWPYKEVRHNVIKSQSEIKVRSQKIETLPRPTPKKLCIYAVVLIKN